MAVYTVHMKKPNEGNAASERAVFIRDGFVWSAFLFGPLWLVRHGLWVGLAGWIAIQTIIFAWVFMTVAGIASLVLLELLFAFLLGLEATHLRETAMGRRGYMLEDIVEGDALADAERRFFARAASLSDAIPAPAPSSFQSNLGPRMVGLFPSAGS